MASELMPLILISAMPAGHTVVQCWIHQRLSKLVAKVLLRADKIPSWIRHLIIRQRNPLTPMSSSYCSTTPSYKCKPLNVPVTFPTQLGKDRSRNRLQENGEDEAVSDARIGSGRSSMTSQPWQNVQAGKARVIARDLFPSNEAEAIHLPVIADDLRRNSPKVHCF